jgi:arylsulfatase A-like enzyme
MSISGIRAAGLFAAMFLPGACAAPAGPGSRPPNVVLIVSDDQGYAEMSCQGGDLPTPHLDALAASGVRFTSAYVTAPYCSPSRAGFLTGRYQQRFGHEMNPVQKMNDRPEVGLPPSERTIADHLRAAGYRTGMVGKWHLGNHPPHLPRRRGFDEFVGFLREGRYYLPSPEDGVSRYRDPEPDYNRLNPMLRGETEVQETGYLTDVFAREASAFLERNATRPFFLYLSFNAPHSPMQAKKDVYERFSHVADHQRRVWAAMMSSMDEAVGAVRSTLRRLGLERDTLVVFFSDHGGPTRELTSRNDPFSGGKGSMREGGLRVPFLMSWPGRLPAGKVEARPVSALDVLPTSLAAAGTTVPEGLDGVDLLPFLEGGRKDDPHPLLFWRMGAQWAVREGRWKLLRDRGQTADRLHDLEADPEESTDLAPQEPERAAALKARWNAWNATLAPPRW